MPRTHLCIYMLWVAFGALFPYALEPSMQESATKTMEWSNKVILLGYLLLTTRK